MTEHTSRPLPEHAPGRSPAADLSAIVKTYDVRGVAGEHLTAEVARALGAAFADFLGGESLIVAHDMRVSSPELSRAVIEGAVRRGAIVADAGLASTDQLYCASGLHRAAGLMITASHNPARDNGMKLCLPGARPISRDTGLQEIRRGAEAYLDAGEIPARGEGRFEDVPTLEDYARTLRGLVPLSGRRPLRIVIDAASAMAGHTAPAVLGDLPSLEIVPLHFTLDGTFPHHPADPLNPANLEDLRQAVLREGADLGLAFDGDADRCVVVDETGAPVPPSAITALIAQREIARARAAGEERPVVVANLVSSRHVAETVRAAGGEVLRSPVGHSLIKALMAEHGAVFGGEHSAHYYFRDFFFADSGMLAALHVLAALEESDGPASALVAAHTPYPASGELNLRHADPASALTLVEQRLGEGAQVDHLDGLTLTRWDEAAPAAERWWLSLRSSNTEPLLRLNVEAAEQVTLEHVRDEVLALLEQDPGASPWEQDPEEEPMPAPAEEAEIEPAADALLPEGPSGADVPGWVRSRLRCPDCGGELRDVEAALQCTDCRRVHAVEGGIPVLIAGRADAPDA